MPSPAPRYPAVATGLPGQAALKSGLYLAPAQLAMCFGNRKKSGRKPPCNPDLCPVSFRAANPFLGDIGLNFSGHQIGTATAGANEAPAAATHAPGTGVSAGFDSLFLTPPPPDFPALLAFRRSRATRLNPHPRSMPGRGFLLSSTSPSTRSRTARPLPLRVRPRPPESVPDLRPGPYFTSRASLAGP